MTTFHAPCFYSVDDPRSPKHDYGDDASSGIPFNFTPFPPYTSTSYAYGPSGSPLTITPTTEIGTLVGVSGGLTTYRWFCRELSDTVDMSTLGAMLTRDAYVSSYTAIGTFHVVSDVVCPDPGDPDPHGLTVAPATGTVFVQNNTDVQLKVVTDGTTTLYDGSTGNGYYHNGWLNNNSIGYSLADTGTDPATLDFTLLTVPPHSTIWGDPASFAGYRRHTADGSPYPFTVGTDAPYASIQFSLVVTTATTTWTKTAFGYTRTDATNTYEQAPDHVYFVYYDTIGPSVPGGSTRFKTIQVAADIHRGMISCAYISQDSTRSLSVAFCPSARHQTFEAAQLIESSGIDEVGLTYLPNGRCLLTYKVLDSGSGVRYYRTSDHYGRSGWSARTAFPTFPSEASGSGVGAAHTFRVAAQGLDAVGTLSLLYNRDATGLVWVANAAIPDGYGPLCGAAWTKHGWGIIYQDATPAVQFRHIQKIDTTGDLYATGLSGYPCSLTCLRNGTLVACLVAAAYTSTSFARSFDHGVTWHSFSGGISMSSGSYPPVLLSDGDVVFVVTAPPAAVALITNIT